MRNSSPHSRLRQERGLSSPLYFILYALVLLVHASLFNIPLSAVDGEKPKSSAFANARIIAPSYPGFNDQGYRTHLIQGDQITVINPTQFDIRGLRFMQYPGDGSTIAETSLTAPSATVFDATAQNARAIGKESVELSHANEFDATGEDWAYDHAQKKITINKNARIAYKAPLKNFLGHGVAANDSADAKVTTPSSSQQAIPHSEISETLITSTALELRETADADGTTLAIFTGNVTVITTDDLRLTCDRLEVTAARLTDKNPALQPIDKFQLLVATGNVRLTQGARTVTCQRADVLPREDRITLTGSPIVTDAAVRIAAAADPLTLHRTDRRIEGKRARITTPPWETQPHNSKPAPKNAAPPPADTIITAENYVMWETADGLTHATLDGAVSIVTTDTRLTCDHLELTADNADTLPPSPASNANATTSPPASSPSPAQSEISTTPLRHLLATGNVRVTQNERSITCGSAEVLPQENKLILTQNPVLTDHASTATATADTFILLQTERRLTAENPKITYPPIKDLSAKAGSAGHQPGPEAPAPVPTVITSRALTMWTTPDEISHALFDNDVHVTATNLDLTCNHLALDADPAKTPPPPTQPAPDKSTLDPKLQAISAKLLSMVATGVVRFKQLAREVSCERAEIIPPEDRITLTGKPLIIDHDKNLMITGKKLNLIRGEQDVSGEEIQMTGAPINLR